MHRILHLCSVLQRTMRDGAISLSRQDRGVCLGADPGYRHYRQATKAYQRRLRQLHHKVSVRLPYSVCDV